MRDLRRNQQTIWYSLQNVTVDKDEWGNTEDIKDYGGLTIKEARNKISMF